MADGEDMAALRRKRALLKSRVTTFSTFIASLRKYNKTRLTTRIYDNLRKRLETFFEVLESFEEIQDQIDALSQDISPEVQERAAFESLYFDLTAEASAMISGRGSLGLRTGEGSSSDDTSLPLSQHTLNPQPSLPILGVKLPTIELPKFDGNYEKWLEFRDIFKSLIHSNASVSDMQRYHYLRASLVNDAAEIIKSLEFCENNYNVAWNLLCDRYDKSPLLVYNHVKSLFDLAEIKRESAQRLRTLVDNINKHINALAMLGQDTNGWDVLIIHLVTNKLDAITSREWEQSKTAEALPTLCSLITFLKKRADLLEVLESKTPKFTEHVPFKSSNQKPNNSYFKKPISRSMQVTVPKCSYCGADHFVTNCTELLKISVENRMTNVLNAHLCINCLRPGHRANFCRSTFRCKECNLRHHTLLHLGNSRQSVSETGVTNENKPSTSTDNTDRKNAVVANCTQLNKSTTLLPTAVVFVFDRDGNRHTARVLLDTGSQANFVTNSFAAKLKLLRHNINISVAGISQEAFDIHSKCQIHIQSRLNLYKLTTSCLITNSICGNISHGGIRASDLDIPPNLKLADPEFLNSRDIDVLLGSECFWQLLSVGQHKIGTAGAVLQKTRFGWVVAEHISLEYRPKSVTCNHIRHHSDKGDKLVKFWELEECRSDQEENSSSICDLHFKNTHTRNSDGRFIVEIPFGESIATIGDSYEQARRRFLSLERKLNQNIELKRKYVNFINEYLSMGHMSLSNKQNVIAYYLPHHCVHNTNSVTTKLRVVFDGSAIASCGTSLNNHQQVGPVIQPDLFQILLRFRQHQYIVTADIAKMYRQVLVKQEQRNFQRILWRENSNEPINSYDLNTVTYGTSAASYLAIRCLEQLAVEVERQNPAVANVIRNCFYVDDLIAGFDSINEAIHICKEVSSALHAGCFPLRKWASNSNQIDSALCEFHTDKQSSDMHIFDNKGETKTLGLQWSRYTDTLSYQVSCSSNTKRITKRIILSEIASIFDPLGLISPTTIVAKIFIQRLWLEKLNWDESLPVSLANEWLRFRESLGTLNTFEIPRFSLSYNAQRIHLHGFCDASKAAYGATIYLVCEHDGIYTSNLLCAKSRVAPVKEQTIPRLELCAAVLLSNLYSITCKTLTINLASCTLWSDSVVALCWIRSEPRTLKTFISNRVNNINSLTDSAFWRHVPTTSNPADVLSRGISPQKLQVFDLWWHGPLWLAKASTNWPVDVSRGPEVSALAANNGPDLQVLASTITTEDIFNIKRHSSLRSLTRITAYVFRFISNIRLANRHERNVEHLTVPEVNEALVILIKREQKHKFAEEMRLLKNEKPLKGSLASLTLFLDKNNVIRVGGRLRHTNLNFSRKHQILLPSQNHLTKLIIEREHIRLLHAGPQATLNSVRRYFWPLLGRNIARKVVFECITCRRCNPQRLQPRMGDLPAPRVTPAFPFSRCGVDFAGPYQLKTFAGRGTKCYKAYIALFVCFATRAIHLELVTSLDTAAFIACLRRFVARRGRPSHIYSDNATNFHGAKNEIHKYVTQHSKNLTEAAAEDEIVWRFIPALSPNFGGLWEAGVKSVKHHITRVIGDRSLTYEEFITYLHQIEAILNSRPITPLSTDPNDDSPLTPAHFLIGRPFETVPDQENVLDIPEGRLTKYQRIQALVRGFWKRWSNDYINQLQQRPKWRQGTTRKIEIGDIVLLQESNQPPLRWNTGRIINTHEGKDGIIRVVSVKTKQGIVKRALSKLCPLLPDDDKDFEDCFPNE